jgi:CubicO group peptidase (beta-lactamase class C family)
VLHRWITLAAIACALAATPAAASAETRCASPAPGAPFASRPAPELGFDQAALDAVLDEIANRGQTGAVAVYRYGCLAGARYPERATNPGGPDAPWQSWSVAKSVTALAVARAVTLGRLSLDDRVGGLVTEADRPHGALTLRTLMQQSSGLHWNFARDYGGAITKRDDFIRNALTLPFDHEPGTWFEYAQVPVALTLLAVQRAVAQDPKAFLDAELFGPLGIPAGAWSWEQDPEGHTAGFYGVHMAERYYARLGQLLLQDGAWNGRQLIDPRLVRAFQAPAPTNPSYSLFYWINSGDHVVGPTVQQREVLDGPLVPGAPSDLYGMFGLFEQRVIVIPSLGLVLTRFGQSARSTQPGSFGSNGPFDHDFVGGVMDALRDPDLPPFPAYEQRDSSEPFDPDYGLAKSLTEPQDLLVASTLAEPPLPPAGPPRARAARLVGARVRGDAARLVVGCPPVSSAGDCRGPLQVRSGGATIGAARFDAAPGGQDAVRLHLSRPPAGDATVRLTSLDALDGTTSEAPLGGS